MGDINLGIEVKNISEKINSTSDTVNKAIKDGFISRNLCKGIENGTISNKGQDKPGIKYSRNISFIKLEPNKSYTVSFKALSGKTIRISTNLFETIGSTLIRELSIKTSNFTFTTNANENYVRFVLFTSDTIENPENYISEFQLEEGTEATPYTPYAKSNVELTHATSGIFGTSDYWASKTSWLSGEICIDDNTLWLCLIPNSNKPSEGTEWKQISLSSLIKPISSTFGSSIDIKGYDSTTNSFTVPNDGYIRFYGTNTSIVVNTYTLMQNVNDMTALYVRKGAVVYFIGSVDLATYLPIKTA